MIKQLKKIKLLCLFFNSICLAITPKEEIGFLFAHGLGASQNQIHWYKQGNALNWHILREPCHSFNFPWAREQGGFDKTKVTFAQKIDVEALQSAHEYFCNDSTKNISHAVLVGMSNGAASVINYAATNPKKVKALILEAPYDIMENVVHNQLKNAYLGWVPGLTRVTSFLVRRWYPNYDKNGIKPINEITKIDKDLPILFIHSKADTLISIRSSKALYAKLKRNGHKHIYFLELRSGVHAGYQHGKDAKKYMATVHAFYEKYQIPHDTELAKKGKVYLEKCRI